MYGVTSYIKHLCEYTCRVLGHIYWKRSYPASSEMKLNMEEMRRRNKNVLR